MPVCSILEVRNAHICIFFFSFSFFLSFLFNFFQAIKFPTVFCFQLCFNCNLVMSIVIHSVDTGGTAVQPKQIIATFKSSDWDNVGISKTIR